MFNPTEESSDSQTYPRISGLLETAIATQDQAERLFADLAMEDDRCTDCGLITSGSKIAGQLCLICDSCLTGYVIQHIGANFVRERLAELDPVYPCLFVDIDGRPNPVNARLPGVRTFNLSEAAEHFGWQEPTLEVIWRLAFEETKPLRIAQ